MRELKINGIYKHFKGDRYIVEDVAIDFLAFLITIPTLIVLCEVLYKWQVKNSLN